MTDRLGAVDILTVGEAMGLVVAEEIGPLATADRALLRVGGSELNLAIAASRLGASVAWAGRLGVDGLGDKIERTLRGEGVHVLAHRDPSRSTGLMVKERRTTDHTRITYYRSASAGALLSRDDVSDEILARCRLLHVTGITSALSPSALDAVRSLVDRANERSVPVSLDVNYRSALWSPEEAGVELAALLPRVGLLFGGLEELAILDSRIVSAETAWECLSTFGLTQLVVKQGAQGATVITDGGVVHHPAFPVRVVDTVGAGDAFVAGYLVGWLNDLEPAVCLERAARSGALACTVSGDWEGAPTLAELSLLDAADPVSR